MPFGVITKGMLKKKKSTKMNVGGLKKKVTTIVKGLAELKYHTHKESSIAIFRDSGYNAVLTDIPIVPAGASPTDYQRIGDQVTISSCNIKIRVTVPFDATIDPVGGTIRCIVYQYKPNNGLLAPNLTRLLDTDPDGNRTDLSFRAVDFTKDYHVVYDKTKIYSGLRAATGSGTSNSCVRFDFWVPLKKIQKKIQYDGATVSANNHLYCALFGDGSNTIGVADPQVSLSARTRFLDL